MRIQNGRVYIEARTPGLSGFQEWDKLELRLCDAKRARLHRPYILGEYEPETDTDSFRLENGRCPEFQPVTDSVAQAIAWALAGETVFWKVVAKHK